MFLFVSEQAPYQGWQKLSVALHPTLQQAFSTCIISSCRCLNNFGEGWVDLYIESTLCSPNIMGKSQVGSLPLANNSVLGEQHNFVIKCLYLYTHTPCTSSKAPSLTCWAMSLSSLATLQRIARVKMQGAREGLVRTKVARCGSLTGGALASTHCSCIIRALVQDIS